MYEWLVFVHLVGLVLFAISHGVSAFAAFRLRAVRDPQVIASRLADSRLALGPMYVGLLLLLVGGLGAAWAGGLLLAPWVVASYVVLVVVVAVMYSVASPFYVKLRELIGDGTAAVDADELERRLASRRPEVLVTFGGLGLVVLVWLMVIKPS